MKTINVGVVGLGFMGLTHMKAYGQVPGSRIAAVCDSVRLPADGKLGSISGNIVKTDDLKLDMSQVQGYRNYEDMVLNPEIDLVDICVPTPLHIPIASAALKAGKHVLCEKPVARTSAAARELEELAKVSKGVLMPAMCLRFWPEWAWLRQAVQEGRYGKALAARFRRVSEPPAWSQASYFKGEDSGGALLDLHIHDTDFVQFCFGRPSAVFSTGLSRFSGAIDYVMTQYHVDTCASVHAEGSWLMGPGFGFNMSYTVNFENATADYDSGRGAEALKVFEKGQQPRVIQCPGGDGYVGELAHIVECIREGKQPSTVTIRDGIGAIEICEAEEKSVKTGQLVRL